MSLLLFFFFFNDTPTTEIYTLSLHDALPIFINCTGHNIPWSKRFSGIVFVHKFLSISCFQNAAKASHCFADRSEEHTSELQSRQYLVCRLLLEKKKNKVYNKNPK